MSKKYINPVHGKSGVFGSDYPAEMTKEEVIRYGAFEIIGSCSGIESAFDHFLKWLQDAGNQKIDFRFDNLSIEELQIIDDIVFCCDGCGWLHAIDESHYHYGDNLCGNCYDEIEYEEFDECDEEEDDL